MNDLVPLQFRILAVLFYIVGSIPMALLLEHVISSYLNIYDFGIGGYINDNLLQVVAGVSISTLTAIIILWLATKQIHPFVDGAGRGAFSCTLSSIIATLIFGFAPSIIPRTADNFNFFLSSIIVCWACATCLAIAYFISFTIAIVFALQGYQFTNFLIYPFLR